MSDSQRPSEIRTPQLVVRFLALIGSLFIFHTLVLFYTAYMAEISQHELARVVGVHLAGILIVLGSFMALFVAHVAEGAAWGLYIWKRGLLPTFPESLYFSLSSLTAVGYGDVILPKESRILGSLMATSGLIMFGCPPRLCF
ncbi:MAG: potassium channel family protein [Terrimicrobiaceae bacterium]